MKKYVVKFPKLKSIVTMAVTGTFCQQVVVGQVDPKDFIMIVMVIYTFWFTRKDSDKEVK